MTDKKIAFLSVIALLGAAAIFGIPNSVWWDNGGITPRILLGAGIVGWVYVLWQFISNKIDSSAN